MKTPASLVAVVLFAFGSPLLLQADPTPGPVNSITPVTAATIPPTLVTVLPRERFQVFATNATKLKKLSDAVAKMKSRPVSDKTSWAYWANIHGVMGASTDPQWNQCRHAQWWFVAWHRAYVLELEHQLQAAINDKNFRLPYWDYLDPGQRKIPAAFKKTTSPLFESKRDANEVGFELSDLKKTFSATKYTGNMIAGGFGGASVSSGTVNGSPSSKRGRMEQNPHNTVHVDIGGLMGDPRTAAQDPIFWLHHCNIDRIWEVWIKNGPHTNPAGAFTTETFTFPGVNGQPVTHKVADMFDTKKLGYTYDRLDLQVPVTSSTPAPAPPPKPQPQQRPTNSPGTTPEPSPTVAESPSPSETDEPLQPRITLATVPDPTPIAVTAKPQTVKIKTAPVAPEQNMLRKDLDHKKTKKKVLLTLEGIEFTEPPKHLYKVYFNLPNADAKAGDAPQYVGTLAFFESPDGHHGHDGGDRTETFDITDVLATAKKAGTYDANNLAVTIVPVSAPKEGKRAAPENAKEITIKNISIKTTDE